MTDDTTPLLASDPEALRLAAEGIRETHSMTDDTTVERSDNSKRSGEDAALVAELLTIADLLHDGEWSDRLLSAPDRAAARIEYLSSENARLNAVIADLRTDAEKKVATEVKDRPGGAGYSEGLDDGLVIYAEKVLDILATASEPTAPSEKEAGA